MIKNYSRAKELSNLFKTREQGKALSHTSRHRAVDQCCKTWRSAAQRAAQSGDQRQLSLAE